MSNIVVYTTSACPYCVSAKKLLTQKGLKYTEIAVDTDTAKRNEMLALTGRRTVPQIVINGEPIGGFDDLSTLNASGKLDRLLEGGAL